MATWGSGKPVIALGSDIDCIPQASQKPGVAYHDPIIEGAPGHGEGHNSGMPLNITAALALKKIMERDRIPGTIVLWPGVAEELLATKAYFVRAGVFKDVDVVLFDARRHQPRRRPGATAPATAWCRSNTPSRAKARTPRAAPWRGRSALDAVRVDGHRLELPARAPAHAAALALRHHQRRRPAERRAVERRGLVLLPRNSTTSTSRRCGTSATGWRRRPR